jgi:hypothetical protein
LHLMHLPVNCLMKNIYFSVYWYKSLILQSSCLWSTSTGIRIGIFLMFKEGFI